MFVYYVYFGEEIGDLVECGCCVVVEFVVIEFVVGVDGDCDVVCCLR